MADICSVVLAGRLAFDPELKYLGAQNSPFCTFKVAVGRRAKRGDQWETKFVEVDCKLWGKDAEYLGNHGRRGSSIVVQGELDVEEWEDKSTQAKRRKLMVLVREVSLIGGSSFSTKPRGEERQQEAARASAPRESHNLFPIQQEELPF